MKSPLWHAQFMGKRIDLSQLVEVGDPFYIDRYYFPGSEKGVHAVGFTYRFSEQAEQLVYARRLIKGPTRNQDLTLQNPNDVLLTVREEAYYVYIPRGPDHTPAREEVVIVHEDDEPVALKHIKQEHASLIEAWLQWKEAEPEIYAIIRKHLS